jgi:hypothetical protein
MLGSWLYTHNGTFYAFLLLRAKLKQCLRGKRACAAGTKGAPLYLNKEGYKKSKLS